MVRQCIRQSGSVVPVVAAAAVKVPTVVLFQNHPIQMFFPQENLRLAALEITVINLTTAAGFNNREGLNLGRLTAVFCNVVPVAALAVAVTILVLFQNNPSQIPFHQENLRLAALEITVIVNLPTAAVSFIVNREIIIINLAAVFCSIMEQVPIVSANQSILPSR